MKARLQDKSVGSYHVIRTPTDLNELSSDVESIKMHGRFGGSAFERLAEYANITNLDLTGCVSLDDGCLAALVKLRNLAALDLGGCGGITDVGLRAIGQLRGLKKLDLSFCSSISDRGLSYLVGLGELRSIRLMACYDITDGGVDFLCQLPLLEEIELQSCERISDNSIRSCSQLDNLRVLVLPEFGDISDAGIAYLATHCRSLERLEIVSLEKVSDNGLCSLSELHDSLISVSVFGCPNVTNSVCVTMQLLERLRELHLTHMDIDDRGISLLSSLVGLQCLDLQGTAITDCAVDSIASLAELQRLDLSRTGISDLSISRIQTLSKLSWFAAVDTRITRSGFASLRKALPGLTVVA